jgi:ATP-dependent phosphofructokinase / diphosphate-dependent phosphofructokinase
MAHIIGILTAGGDTPGLNAAIRAVGKTAINTYDMRVIGFRDGFRGLMQNRTIPLDKAHLAGILTIGGTILGTSRDKPHKMPVGGEVLDMTNAMMEVYEAHRLDALVCLGGGGTAKNAFRLAQKGMNVITLPKTIDNDVSGTDRSFGFDTALNIASEAIDRLHSTAHSHHRIIVVEMMGHNTGWLALGAGMAGGADVILIPEIPFHTDLVAEAIIQRNRGGSQFSIVAVSEGAMSVEVAEMLEIAHARIAAAGSKSEKREAQEELARVEELRAASTLQLTEELEARTGLESRVTILGHVQRGGTPSPVDRLLATQFGVAAAHYVTEGRFGIMVGMRGDRTVPVPLEEVVGIRHVVPLDHPWVTAAQDLGISFGAELP